MRLLQLERQQRAATAARASSEDDASSRPYAAGAEQSSRMRPVKAKREAPTTTVRDFNHEDDGDWESCGSPRPRNQHWLVYLRLGVPSCLAAPLNTASTLAPSQPIVAAPPNGTVCPAVA
jgi:hypothetical protein